MQSFLKQIIIGVIIGLILGIGSTLIIIGQKIARLETQVESLKEKSPQKTSEQNKSDEKEIPIITITYPIDQDRVFREIYVKGIYEDVPDDLNIWVYIYALGAQLYFPQNIVTKSRSGTWKAKAIIGSTDPSDIGAAFEIGVLILSKTTSSKLRGKQYGIKTFPKGTKIMDMVTVFRK